MKKQIRENFRNSVFKRDNYTCVVCKQSKKSEDLDAHHITDRSEMPNGGYVKENGITVCKFPNENQNESCHMKVEKFHITGGKEWNENLHPDDLYKMINSSYKLAYKKSER